MEILISVASKIGEYMVEPIGRQFSYLINYNSNIKNLKDQLEKLSLEKDGVLLSVDAAKRNGDVVAPEVESWLRKVDGINEEIGRSLEDVNASSLQGWCPNLKSRRGFSREAKKKNEDVVKLLENGKFSKVAYPAPPPRVGASLIGGFKGLNSRMLLVNEVMEVLKDDKIGMIGIHGMAGVGKTTMVKDVIKRAEDELLFDVVVMAVVSQSPDNMKIQGEIAYTLGLKFDGESIHGRAQQLHRRIMNSRRILVVLDDVWTDLDFDKMGIPSWDDHKRCKILLTSRSRDVLSMMKSQRNFAISVLSEDEAWELFREMAGISIDSPNLQPTAKKVANECGGLPLAIAIVGKALGDKDEYVWKDALQQLKKSSISSFSEMQEFVYSRIELSFHFLGVKEAKSCFLLCCLFPEDFDIPIEYLVRYGMGLELFDDINTVEEARYRARALVDKLKRCSLLLDSINNMYVKMHDVVRDTAISIASKGENGFLVRCATVMREWPKKTFKDCTAISIMNCEMHEIPEDLVYPKLKLLQIRKNKDPFSSAIPHNFFDGMKGLQILALGDMIMPSLPSSVQYLKNLQALSIVNCGLPLENIDISAIQALEKLEILSFAGSCISKLPKEIGLLKRLRLLDLTGCRSLRYIVPGVLSSLHRLEELYMQDSFDRWESTEEGVGKTNAGLAELKPLSHLMVLVLHVPEDKLLPKDLHFENLKRFDISIGFKKSRGKYFRFPNGWGKNFRFNFYSNSLTLRTEATYIMDSGIYPLLQKSEVLLLELQNLKNVLCGLGKDGLPYLKYLIVFNCKDMEYLINATDWTPHAAFPLLESLTLHSLPKLKGIWHGQVPKRLFGGQTEEKLSNLAQLPYFGNLKFLEVHGCHELKSVLPMSIARSLFQLQVLKLTFCDKMEAIVSRNKGDDFKMADMVVFPNVKNPRLDQLPRLIGFCKEMDADDLGSVQMSESMRQLFNHMQAGSHATISSDNRIHLE